MSTVSPPAVDSTTSLAARAEAAVRELQDRLQSTRRSLIAQRIGVGIGSIFAVWAVCLAVSATTDWMFELATVWRSAWMLGVVAMLATASIVGWRRWIATYSLADTAVDAEGRLSQFGQRLRTTLDYEQRVPQPAAASPSLLKSLHEDTRKLAEQTEWNDAVDSRPLFRTLLSVSIVSLAWIALLIMWPEFRVAAARAMLMPFEYTTVTYSPQTAVIRPGEAVTVKAIITGRPIASAQLRHRSSGPQSEWVTVDLNPADAIDRETDNSTAPTQLHGELMATLEGLTQDTEFEVIAGPRSLPPGLIRVLQPLKLEKSEARILPPSYTGRTEETVATLDLKVLEGSTIDLKMEFNRPAAEAKLISLTQFQESKTPADGDETAKVAATTPDRTEIPLVLDGNCAFGTLADLRKSTLFTLSARTADGMSLDPVQIRVRVQLDRKPQVQFIEPAEELVVTPTTEVPVVVEAADDLGLYKVGVMYQVGSGPMQTLMEQNADGSNEPLHLSTEMMLEEHHLTHQDAVTYYAFAEDNYFGQPRRTTTPLRFIDIRPYKLAFQVVDQQGGPCNGSSVTLEELITRQRQGLSQAFQAAQQKVEKATTARLSEGQEELLDATNEFAAGMAALGMELPVLGEAVTHMETAIESLDVMKVPDAVSAEEQALAALIRARENIRKKLNQSSSQSASACRKFDREQRQKLRMPEKKKSDQEQQLAQARQKLDDLAKRERQWSQQAQQCCSSSSSSSSGKPSQSQSSTPKESQPQTSQSPQDSNSPSNSPDSPNEKSETPNPAEVAAAQEKMQAELAEIQKQLEKLNAAGKAAREQAQQAAESMNQGLAELKNQDGDAAAREGERSAEQLEQLSAHLATMNARDFGQRLDQAQKIAQQLASRQESIEQRLQDHNETKGSNPKSTSESQPAPGSKSTSEQAGGTSGSSAEKPGDGNVPPQLADRGTKQLARDQQALAGQTGLLVDLLDGLNRDAGREAGSVKQKLDQAQAENPPREIAAGMSQVAEDLQAERMPSAHRGATQARERLQDLSKSLGTARAEYAQPQLKELIALEEQLAQVQQQMKRLQGKGQDPASVGQKWQQLETRLDKLAAADKRLAEALRQLREGPPETKSASKGADGKPSQQNNSSTKAEPAGSTVGGKEPPVPGSRLKPAQVATTDGQPTPEGFYSWLELGDFTGIREVSKVLQTRIQEAILAGALMDADQPVPPAYRELVEKYYRALSDDLR